MDKKILINARHPEEKRVAIVEEQKLTDFYVEMSSAEHLRGNVYKGVITALDRGLQAAFVDFGPEKHGFLPLREVMSENYRVKTRSKSPKITEVLAKGQELIVQVEQDRRGTKGASLTNRISIPGRYLVMIPGKERIGISRKIEDRDARDRMKKAFKGLKVPKGMGFILRTAGADRSTEDLTGDLKYLTKMWNKIKRDGKKAPAPSLIYKEEDISVRTVRDYLTTDVTEVLVDETEAFRSVKKFLKLSMPWRSINVKHYRQKKPLFDMYDLEDQIGRLSDRRVWLRGRGSIIIDKAEALTAIDVNSGGGKKSKDIESLALKTNLEAADEIARQLRLRDIGGLIVIDFIDIESGKKYQEIEERLRKALDLDKAHFDLTRISRFGILEMTRERMRTAYFDVSRRTCPTCVGEGVVKAPELVALAALREAHSLASKEGLTGLTCRLPVESANYLMNRLRDNISAVEKEFSLRITVMADLSLPPGEFACDSEGAEAEEEKKPEEKKPRKRTRRGGRRASKKAKKEETEEKPEEKAAPEAPKEETPAEAMPKKKRKSRRPRRRSTKKKKPESEPEAEKPTESEAPEE